MKIEELMKECRQTSSENGWEEDRRTFGDQCTHFHAEISEAWEDFRNHHGVDEIYYDGKKPCGIPVELADVIIRIFSFCECHSVPLVRAISEKMAYNKTRSYRHGGKKI